MASMRLPKLRFTQSRRKKRAPKKAMVEPRTHEPSISARPGHRPNKAPAERPRIGAAGKQTAVRTRQQRKNAVAETNGRAAIIAVKESRLSLSFSIVSQSPSGVNRNA